MERIGEKRRKARDREKMKKEMREQAKKDWAKRKALHKRDKKWQAKKARANVRRMQQGRPLRNEDEDESENENENENENADSMDAANGSERDNGGQPVVLKSFSGETIETPYKGPLPVPENAAPDGEQDSIANAVSSTVAECTTAPEESHEE